MTGFWGTPPIWAVKEHFLLYFCQFYQFSEHPSEKSVPKKLSMAEYNKKYINVHPVIIALT